jgi:GTP cyclohydrolase I
MLRIGQQPYVRIQIRLLAFCVKGHSCEETMNALVQPLHNYQQSVPLIAGRPSRADVEAAFRTIIRWTGDDPARDGLLETPARVTRAFEEYFAGYAQNPEDILCKTFEETGGYDDMIVLRGIPFESHCEHHLAPIIGRAWVAYLPTDKVVGISKLTRVVEAFSKRLQSQEKMTAQIADAIHDALRPIGVGVVIKAIHHCMSTRGVHKHGIDMVTSRMLGCFRDNPMTRKEFLAMVNAG